MNNQHYKNPNFRGKCIDYSIAGYIFIKNLKIPNLDVKIKSHVINLTDSDYSPYHYYLELKHTNEKRTCKIIIDCEGDYRFNYYKNRYNPKTIRQIKITEIKNGIKQIDLEFISRVEENITHFLKVYKWI